jgi:hypothetical protein
MIFQPFYSNPSLSEPDIHETGGDTLLWTGYYLAAASFRYSVTKDPADLDKVVETVRGLYALTHTLGVPGNMARCAFPLAKADKFMYPGGWVGRIDDGFVYTGTTTLIDPTNKPNTYPQFVYYTRVSRDDTTGLITGLGTFLSVLDPKKDQALAGNAKLAKAREIVCDIVSDVWTRLANNNFVINDHTGRNDAADNVDGMLKLALDSVYTKVITERSPSAAIVNQVQHDYEDEFNSEFGFFGDPAEWFDVFSNLQQYYAWNLRFARVLTVYLSDENPEHRKKVAEFTWSNLFSHVDDHQNPYFIYVYNMMRLNDPIKLDDALFSIKATSIRPLRCYDSPRSLEGQPTQGFWKIPLNILEGIPHLLDVSEIIPAHLRVPTTYFKWQEDPWDVGYAGTTAQEVNTGLDYLLPYWMGRYYGFLK